jgi:sec-independent protein translocase protein TatA
MMGLDNPIHILFLLVIALLVFGAKRLPEMGKSLGEGLRGFKESVSGETPAAHLTAAQDAALLHSPVTAAAAPDADADWATRPRAQSTPATPVA